MSYVFNDGADAPVRLTEGRHKLKITGWDYAFSGNGKPYVSAVLRSAEGGKHTEKFFATPAAGWRLDLLFKSAGVRWPKGTAIDLRALGPVMIGRIIDAAVAYGEPNTTTGKRYLEVKELFPAEKFDAPAIPSDDEKPADDDDGVPF